MNVEHYGEGLNLTIQVLDGIMCHNGEILNAKYEPVSKTKEEFLKEYEEAYYDLKKANKNHPMTLEGCVVRISDVIGYIGRDIEDAIMIGKIKREDIPNEITSVLGTTNKDIINTIILDIIEHSMDKPYIEMSPKVYDALLKLKTFNYQYIYQYSLSLEEKEYYTKGMNCIYECYLNDLENKNMDSTIYKIFLNKQCSSYLDYTSDKRKVIDFIAGMTDEFFIKEINKYMK